MSAKKKVEMRCPRKIVSGRRHKGGVTIAGPRRRAYMRVEAECGHSFEIEGIRVIPEVAECVICAAPMRPMIQNNYVDRDLIPRRLLEIGRRTLAPWRGLADLWSRESYRVIRTWPEYRDTIAPEYRAPFDLAHKHWMDAEPKPYAPERQRKEALIAAIKAYEAATSEADS